MLFSATFSPEIKRLAGSYLQDPVTIEVARSNATASTVEQRFIGVPDEDKRRAMERALDYMGLTAGTPLESAAADWWGNDVAVGDASTYFCTHVRLTRLIADVLDRHRVPAKEGAVSPQPR